MADETTDDELFDLLTSHRSDTWLHSTCFPVCLVCVCVLFVSFGNGSMVGISLTPNRQQLPLKFGNIAIHNP